jgi:hypothetical protein
MAVGTITYDTDPVRRAGNLWEIHGLIEAGTTPTTFAIVNTKHSIVACDLLQTSTSPAITYSAQINASSYTAGSQMGSIHVDASAGTNLRFKIQYA